MADERADLLAKLDKQRAELLAELIGLTDDRAGLQPEPGAWSPKQQLSHLARAERMYVACVKRVQREQKPDLGMHWAQNREEDPGTANARSLVDLLADLAVARGETKRAIGETADDEFRRVGRNTPFGEMTIAQLLRSLYRHDRMHVDQIAGREPSYQPKVTDPSISQRSSA